MKTIFLLHGFLGSSQDWEPVKDYFNNDNETKIVTPNFLSSEGESEESLSPDDLNSFDSLVTKLRTRSKIDFAKKEKRIFVGYSLGGRIGLNWLRLFPNDFDHWVFVSANPGLKTEKDRVDRAKGDQSWIDQLNKDGLENFYTKWNGQPVFQSTYTNLQNYDLRQFDKLKLEKCFSNLSLANQLDHREIVKMYEDRLTWVVGNKDEKFVQVAEDLKASGVLKDFVSLEAGHRVHLDQPAVLTRLILGLKIC